MTSKDALSKHEETHTVEEEPKQTVAAVQCESTMEQDKVNGNDDMDWNEYFNGNQLHSIYMKNHMLGLGKKCLTSLQLAGGAGPHSMSDLDANLNMLMASLLCRISKGERNLLAKIMTLIVQKTHTNTMESMMSSVKTPIPSCKNDLRRCTEGKVAILNNVPIPLIKQLPNGDSCVLPSDFLRLHFPLGKLEPHMIKTENDTPDIGIDGSVEEIWQTNKAKETLKNLENNDNESHKLLIGEWSDGMDPNGRNKNNRGSVHVTSFTMVGKKENSNDHNLTFPVSISSDKSNHTEVRQTLCEDTKKPREPTIFLWK